MVKHSPNASNADGKAALPQLLGDNLRGGIRIQKSMADRLPDEFISPAVVCLGPRLLALQCGRTAFLEGVEQLEISLFTVAVLLGGPGRPKAHTLPLDQHEKFACDLVVAGELDAALGATQDRRYPIQFEHDGSSLNDVRPTSAATGPLVCVTRRSRGCGLLECALLLA